MLRATRELGRRLRPESRSNMGHIAAERTRLEEEDLGWMLGRSVGEVSFAEPGSWWFRFAGGGHLCTHGGPWRLSTREGMFLCSDDLPSAEAGVEGARGALERVHVVAAEVGAPAPDLVLRLENGLVLELLATSVGYECWETCDPTGRCLTTMGTRAASRWQQSAGS